MSSHQLRKANRSAMVPTLELAENSTHQDNAIHPNATLSYAGSDLRFSRRRLVELIEALSGQRAIRQAQQRFESINCTSDTFFRNAAQALKLQVDAVTTPRSSIPVAGPLLVIANHPLGVIDGLAIGTWLERFRQDLRIIVWDAIGLPGHTPHFLQLDLSSTDIGVLRQNVKVRREATQHMRNGGAVLLFPSGCAEKARHPWSKPQEAPWTAMVAKLYKDAGASVLPVFVDGHNSRLFHAVSPEFETLRRALFLHETRRRIGSTVRLVAGEVVPPVSEPGPSQQSSDAELVRMLRHRTLSLRHYL